MLRKFSVGRTRAKYILSYLSVILVLFSGFSFIIQEQLVRHFYQQYCDQTTLQLSHLADYINKSIISIEQIHSSLQKDVTLIDYRYSSDGYSDYEATNAIKQLDSLSNYINCIVYVPLDSQKVISTNHWVTYDSSVFSILPQNNRLITFDPTPYYNTSYGHLIYVSNGNSGELIYFPGQSATSDHILFYIIDTTTLVWQMNPIMSDFISSIALISHDKQIIAGVNADQLAAKLDSVVLEDGVQNIDDSFAIIIKNIHGDFSVVSLISNGFLYDKIHNVLSDAYLTLILLLFASLAVVFLAMKFTYKPLHELLNKVLPEHSSSQSYVAQLNEAFDSMTEYNHMLKDKLEQYRVSLQKDLLGRVISSCSDASISASCLDAFFDSKLSNQIFVICFRCLNANYSGNEIQKYLNDRLVNDLNSILLEQNTDSSVLLLNYIGASESKYETLVTLLNTLYNEKKVFSAISNGSASPLDIPSLYENAVCASSCWPDVPVAEYKLFPPETNSFEYPHNSINKLSTAFSCHNFENARNQVEQLFQIIDSFLPAQNDFAEFIIPNILVDVLTSIVNSMNTSGIKFKHCSDQYFETLCFCRNFPFIEKRDSIKSNIYSLISFYEEQVNELLTNSKPFIQIFEEYYAQPDFSISLMADKFNVSTTYMSYLIKTNLKMNFSDYLWNMRLSKASELLINTDMNIDEISVSVGYLNTSSFRRKFKQETGVTPSQFRSSKKNETAN